MANIWTEFRIHQGIHMIMREVDWISLVLKILKTCTYFWDHRKGKRDMRNNDWKFERVLKFLWVSSKMRIIQY
jgi:hypothetical protein